MTTGASHMHIPVLPGSQYVFARTAGKIPGTQVRDSLGSLS